MLRLTIRANLPLPPNSLPKIPNPSILLNPSISTILTDPNRQNLPQLTLHNLNNNDGRLPPGGNSYGGGGGWNWGDDDQDKVKCQQPRLNPSGCAELPDYNPVGQIVAKVVFPVMRVVYDFFYSIGISTEYALAVVGCVFAIAAAALVCFLVTLL